MSNKAVPRSKSLANKIKQRRTELGLTIEEAASRAGVGTKTWCRYEAGESIRQDKVKGICKVLNWPNLIASENDVENTISIADYRKHGAWSNYLEKKFGKIAAFSFAAGSDILYEQITDDMQELTKLPKGSHIGQLNCSYLSDMLPPQFLMHYDYEFLYQMQCKLEQMRKFAKTDKTIIAHSVLEELIIYLCNEEALILLESEKESLASNLKDKKYTKDWIFDLFDDMDIVTCLYSNLYLTTDHIYHFSHWNENQFYVDI